MYNEYYENVLKPINFAINNKVGDITIRGMQCTEFVNVQLNIMNNKNIFALPNIRDISNPETKEGKYLRAEFVWYMSGCLLPYFIGNYGSLWNKLVDSRGYVNSNYGYRVFYEPVGINNSMSAIEFVINKLNTDMYTREAIIQYNNKTMYNTDAIDFTCTQNQHFMIRPTGHKRIDDSIRLHNIVSMRSSDIIKGLTFDIPWWDFIGQLIAREFMINSRFINLAINIGSMHCYSSDKELLSSLIDNHENIKGKRLMLKNKNDVINSLSNVVYDILDWINVDEYNECSEKFFAANSDNDIELVKYICSVYVNYITQHNIKPKDEINNAIFDSVFSIIE